MTAAANRQIAIDRARKIADQIQDLDRQRNAGRISRRQHHAGLRSAWTRAELEGAATTVAAMLRAAF